MIGARWVVIGAVLGGCVFTPRPMIPIDDNDPANRTGDASTARDSSTFADSATMPGRDRGPVPGDTTPPTIDASAPADAPPVAATDAGGGAFDSSAVADAPVFDAGWESDAGTSLDTDAGLDCDAGSDGGDGGRCLVDVPATDATDATDDATADATADAEGGVAQPPTP